MQSLILLSALLGAGDFSKDDFWCLDETSQVCGVAPLNKFFITKQKELDKEKFAKLDGVTEVIEVDNEELSGFVISFNDKASTLKALNLCVKTYGSAVRPIVKYKDVDSVVLNQVVINPKSGSDRNDYYLRLHNSIDGKFFITDKENSWILYIKELQEPSNVFRLANLIAQDKFWVNSAQPMFVPLNGYIAVKSSIEPLSHSNLGYNQTFKVVITIFDPKIVLRKDIFPVFGQADFRPNPYAGDNWLDVSPPKITETSKDNVKTVIIEYPFKYLRFGTFGIPPIKIPYERNGELLSINAAAEVLLIDSVTERTTIEDIQPVTSNAMLSVTDVPSPKTNPMIPIYDLIAVAVSYTLWALGSLFILGGFYTLAPMLYTWATTKRINKNKVWKDFKKSVAMVKYSDSFNWRVAYRSVLSNLNAVLIQDFNKSVYNINPDDCDNTLSVLLGELNKVYMENANPDTKSLISTLHLFYKRRVV